MGMFGYKIEVESDCIKSEHESGQFGEWFSEFDNKFLSVKQILR